MTLWRLLDPAHADGTILIGHHNPWMGLAAVLLAIVGASVLLPAAKRFGGQPHRYWWLVGGTLVMALGFWGMHFASMSAYHLPLAHDYDRGLSLLSMVPMIVAGAACIVLCSSEKKTLSSSVATAVVMATGVAVMHFLGMEAMRLPAQMQYTPGGFALSLLAAFVLPLGAFIGTRWLEQRLPSHSSILPVVATLAIGLSVCGFHILAMSATYFVVSDPQVIAANSSAPAGLLTTIGLVVAIVALLSSGLMLDRRWLDLSQSLARSEQRFMRMATKQRRCHFYLQSARRKLC